MYVPSAPNDAGLSIGGVYSVLVKHGVPAFVAPKQPLPRLAYHGLPLWDGKDLAKVVADRGGIRVDPEAVAELLVQGSVIGVVRGRQEFGPR